MLICLFVTTEIRFCLIIGFKKSEMLNKNRDTL